MGTTGRLSSVSAVILAGGLGTRLRTVVVDRPKVLAPVAGKPFLTYLLDQLEKAGIHEVVLCTGYLAQQIQETFGNSYRSLNIKYSPEQESLGTAGALRHALSLISNPITFVMNGDSYCDVSLGALYDHHLAHRAQATVCLTNAEDSSRYGRVATDERRRITRFIEKGESYGPGMINAGIYLIDTDMIQEIPEGGQISLEREVFPLWIGREFYAYCQEHTTFIDIGTPESFKQAQRLFAPGVTP